VIVLGDNLAAAKKLAFELEANGHEVILDDRDTGF
jgi:hypothetical protein